MAQGVPHGKTGFACTVSFALVKVGGARPVTNAKESSLRSVVARVVSRTTLRYTDGPDRATDRPAHVRAGSGLCFVETPRGKRLAVVQDDASFLALVDPATKRVDALALPSMDGVRQFDDMRGNKELKLDLECIANLPAKAGAGSMLVALGSGSSPLRERIVLSRVDRSPPEVRVVDGAALYAALRALPLFANTGAELNIEGMALLPNGMLRLFQRGNGAGALNATVDVPWAGLRAHLEDGAPLPRLANPRRWDLGVMDGVPLTFTDAAVDGDRIFVLASAEDSPSATEDGRVAGCAFGVLADGGQPGALPLTPILDENGAPFVGKAEGLVVDQGQGDLARRRAWIVLDTDDPRAPAQLLELALEW